VLYIHKYAHRDGRVQFPIAFLLFMPDNIPVHSKVLYTRPVAELVQAFAVNKHIALDDPETLETEWLEQKLGLR